MNTKLRTVSGVSALVAAAAGLPGFSACSSGGGVSAEEPDTRPNVIVIMTDDQRVDDLAAMPNTRNLLGARYTDSYASMPLCCPSRATFLTGQYAHNNGVTSNAAPDGGAGALDDAETLPVWLQRSGYHTVMTGKYLNLYGAGGTDGTPRDYIPPGWDEFSAVTYPGGGNYTDYDVTTGSSGPNAPSTGTTTHVADDYQTTHFGDQAVHQIETAPDKPLFMWLSFHAPHAGGGDYPHEFVPVEEKYRGDSTVGLPKSPAFNEAKIGDKPPWIRSLPLLTTKQKNAIRAHRRERRDALRSVDDQVVRILDALREYGELDNTVVMFTSDNGFMQGEHRVADDKTLPYRESAEVPLLVRGPGFTSGTHPEPVSNVDLAPTIVDLANATPGVVMDGMSLLDPIPANRPILLENPAGAEGTPAYSGVVQGRWEYIDYDGGTELYDLTNDPWQQQNRARAATLADTRQRLADLIGQLQ